MNPDIPSVLKAGAVAAIVAAVLGILSAIPFVGPVIFLCYCLGGFLIPIGAGLLYGYFAPGEEDIGDSALGGTLSGGTAGIIYGIFVGLGTLVATAFGGAGIGEAIAASIFSTIFSICGFAVVGIVFGAIGGMIWPFLQNRLG